MAGLFITGILSNKNSFLLKTPNAESGIVSLELCHSNAEQAAILNDWKKNWAYVPKYTVDSVYTREKVCALPTAVHNIKVDFIFIFFYVGLFVFLIWRKQECYEGFLSARQAVSLVFIAGMLDIVENIFALLSIREIERGATESGLALLVFIPSLIKWLLLIFSIAYYYYRVLRPAMKKNLRIINFYLRAFALQLWRFRIVVIGLLVLLVLINFVDQFADLLVSINSSPWGVFWFMLAILVHAVLNWYLPKAYDDAHERKRDYDFKSVYQKSPDYKKRVTLKTYLSRLIGSATLMVPATGILSAMQSYHIKYFLDGIPPMALFVLIIFFYIEILRFKLLDRIFFKNKQFNESRYWILFLIVLLGVAWSFYAGNKQPSSLIHIAISLFGLSFLFLVTVNYREKFQNNIPFVPILAFVSVVVFVFFILFNFRFFSSLVTREDRFYSLPFVISGMVFYTILSSVLLLIGLKYKIQPITFFMVITFMISSATISDFHNVSLVDRKVTPAVEEDSLRVYVRDWLKSRESEIMKQDDVGKEYPVFFVNAFGGGIKAAAWTTMVVGRLDSLMLLNRDSSTATPDFQHYVFSYSGASGGTIGLSLLAASRLKHVGHPDSDTVFVNDKTQLKFYGHDFLTNDLVGILGRDFLMGSFGLNLYADRAKVTEEAWEAYGYPSGLAYDTVLRTAWKDKRKEVPLFVSNTYDINDGVKAILAPVKLDTMDFPGVLLIQDLIKNKDIHLSSAAFLSARFPFVSPTGKFNEQHHFTDGGTVENSGAETSLQLIRVFRSVLDTLKKTNPAYSRVHISILSIPNSIAPMDSVERTKNLYETSAPLLGILNTISGNSIKADITNKYLAGQQGWSYYYVRPNDLKICNGTIHPVLPLGWQISDFALDMMLASVKRKDTDLTKIQQYFLTNFSKY
ncbi:hypothetical protein [Mucilaginibacter agri]|uniref:hypothetical protein n=1 Tax=Mucilaginibacter agri TaxID=2695265 RepID=UPI001AA12CEE|nr:hypothetical protein [Mucilaginibacter agri]